MFVLTRIYILYPRAKTKLTKKSSVVWPNVINQKWVETLSILSGKRSILWLLLCFIRENLKVNQYRQRFNYQGTTNFIILISKKLIKNNTNTHFKLILKFISFQRKLKIICILSNLSKYNSLYENTKKKIKILITNTFDANVDKFNLRSISAFQQRQTSSFKIFVKFTLRLIAAKVETGVSNIDENDTFVKVQPFIHNVRFTSASTSYFSLSHDRNF